ncbi:hypothetical protein P4H65_04700 [Paenibacillus chitinolyticus]|uniref:hypothetical protein n=1 Tax=Paenibacillus chitinolyticus TaxID=79263 RepID=UPI002DBF0BB7|nr:hypothetical protein [Paenibacillus chitinolyticus]MEC0245090.1 hypothetical protein [Paenibacillus chitinolyticus]
MEIALFLLTFLILFIPIFLIFAYYVKKGIYALAILIATYFSYNALVSVLYSLLHISITPVSMGITNIIISIPLCYFIWRKKFPLNFKNISFSYVDSFALLASTAVSFIAFIYLYSSDFEIKFLTSDPAVHFMFSKYFSETGRLLLTFNEMAPYEHMSSYPFLSYVNSGIWMGLVDTAKAKLLIYLISNIFIYGATILAVYCIYKKIVEKTDLLQTTILIIAAAVGYNFNSIMFGFTSQMSGIFLALTLILIVELKWNPYIRVALISINLIGLFYAYYYFIPAGLISILLSNALHFAWNGWRSFVKRLFGIQNIIIGISVVFFGSLYLFILNHTVKNGDVSTIISEGFIYRDLYSDYTPYLLFASIAILYWVKNKSKHTLYVSFIIYVVFALSIFILGMAGKASSYYFYKNYYLLENLFIILFCIGLYQVKTWHDKRIYYAYLGVVLFLLVNTLFIDKPVQANNKLFNTEIARNLTRVQAFNKEISNSMETIYTKEQRKVMDYVLDNKSLLIGDKGYIPVIGSDLQLFWFYSYTAVWPIYNNNSLGAVYDKNKLDYSKWRSDPKRNNYIILLNKSEEWIETQKVDLANFEVIYQGTDAKLLKYKL